VNLAGQHPERLRQMTAQWTQIDEGYTRTRESAPPTKKRFMARPAAARKGGAARPVKF
jgi:hypothetical protein